MQLNTGLDLLHRRIEEWTEQALIEPGVAEREVEAFREYGSDLVAFLHEFVEQLEVSNDDVMALDEDASGPEVCEELVDSLFDAWERIDFGERPATFEVDEFREVIEAVADVLATPISDGADAELDEATDELDEFLATAW